MTEEIQYYEEDLNELVGEVQKGLDSIKKFSGNARVEVHGLLPPPSPPPPSPAPPRTHPACVHRSGSMSSRAG